jgi:hypothetical protein
MNLQKGLFKHVIKDRYWGNQAPLFMARTTEFRHTLFALGNLLPRRMSTPAVELLAGNTKTLEVEEEFDEMRLYREYYLSTSSGLLATSLLMENK